MGQTVQSHVSRSSDLEPRETLLRKQLVNWPLFPFALGIIPPVCCVKLFPASVPAPSLSEAALFRSLPIGVDLFILC